MDTNENHALTKAEGCYHCKPLVQQRDELAAQVDRLRKLLMDKTAESICCGYGVGDSQSGFSCCGDHDVTWPDDVVEVLKETPSAALAALKAQWQAEAVQSILDECEQWSLMGTWGVLVEDISEKLEGLYQRAQEAGDA